jgi:hypothetical protein
MAVTIKSSGPRGAKTYEVRVDGQLYHYTDTLAAARRSAAEARAMQRRRGTRKNPTKAELEAAGRRLLGYPKKKKSGGRYSAYTSEAALQKALAKSSARRSNPSKAQKREKAKRKAKASRIMAALKNFVRKANPAATGASVTRLKGGGFTIRPIKAVKRR